MAVDDSYTKSLLHLNGANDSTTITDEGGKSWNADGGAKLTTAEKKFGSASLRLDPSLGSYIYTPNHSDFDFGSDAFTIDFWWKDNGTTDYYGIMCRDSGVYSAWEILPVSGNLVFFATSNGGSWDISGGVGKSMGAVNSVSFSHYAVVRFGSDFYTFKDGGLVSSWSNGSAFVASSGQVEVGRNNGSLCSNGWLDEPRWSKGVARWVSPFTPRSIEYAPQIKGLFGFVW